MADEDLWNSLSALWIVLIVVGTLAIVGIICLVIWCRRRNRLRRGQSRGAPRGTGSDYSDTRRLKKSTIKNGTNKRATGKPTTAKRNSNTKLTTRKIKAQGRPRGGASGSWNGHVRDPATIPASSSVEEPVNVSDNGRQGDSTDSSVDSRFVERGEGRRGHETLSTSDQKGDDSTNDRSELREEEESCSAPQEEKKKSRKKKSAKNKVGDADAVEPATGEGSRLDVNGYLAAYPKPAIFAAGTLAAGSRRRTKPFVPNPSELYDNSEDAPAELGATDRNETADNASATKSATASESDHGTRSRSQRASQFKSQKPNDNILLSEAPEKKKTSKKPTRKHRGGAVFSTTTASTTAPGTKTTMTVANTTTTSDDDMTARDPFRRSPGAVGMLWLPPGMMRPSLGPGHGRGRGGRRVTRRRAALTTTSDPGTTDEEYDDDETVVGRPNPRRLKVILTDTTGKSTVSGTNKDTTTASGTRTTAGTIDESLPVGAGTTDSDSETDLPGRLKRRKMMARAAHDLGGFDSEPFPMGPGDNLLNFPIAPPVNGLMV